MIEKIQNLDLDAIINPEIQDFYEALYILWEKIGLTPEMISFLKDKYVYDPALSDEERFKKGICLMKEFFIEQKKH